MPYHEGFTVYDADSHIMELPRWLHDYVDPDYRDHLEPFKLSLMGSMAHELLAAAERRQGDPSASREAEGRLVDDDGQLVAKGWEAFGATYPTERSQALDLLGFDGQLVFSTVSGTQFAYGDYDLQHQGLLAHNRAIADFCSGDSRLYAVAILPWVTGDYTLQILEEALDAGCRAMFTPQLPVKGTNSPTHPEYDKVWATLEDRGVPFVTHLGGGNLTAPQEFHRNDIPVTDFVGGGENMRAKDFPMVHHDSAVFFAALIYDGLFDKFPGLRGGCIEQGAGWVPGWLRMLDLTQRSFGRNEPVLQNLKLKPSEYAHQHLFFTPFPHEDVGWLVEQAGDDLFLFSSDWPHPEGGKDPIRYFDGTMDGVSDEARTRFYSANFEALMGATL
jgi:predicted TIM-barrel fold metal-dependent hydrolase